MAWLPARQGGPTVSTRVFPSREFEDVHGRPDLDPFDADLLYESEQFAPTPQLARMLAALAAEIVVVGDSTLRAGPTPGAAAGVAVCLASLGANVELLSVCGDDPGGALLHRQLIDHGVGTTGLVVEAGRRTEVGRPADGVPIRACTAHILHGMVGSAVRDADCVLVADHRRGVMTRPVRQAAMALPREEPPLVVDTGTGDGRCGIAVPGADTNLTLLDDGGTLLCTAGQRSYRTWATPRRARREPATESIIAMLALGLVAELPATTAAELAQAAADVTAGLPESYVCSTARLAARLAGYRSAALPRSDLVQLVRRHRRAGHQIVFTSGSFDLLHGTEVDHLNRARRQGDVLVVAVLSDATVRHRNNNRRPLRGAADRAAALAALSCVDHVTIIDEEVELLDRLRPDVCLRA